MAKLIFRYGAMNCGKTTNLLQVAHNYEEKGLKVIIIKSSIDKKGNDNIVSRLGVERKVDLLLKPNEAIKDKEAAAYISNLGIFLALRAFLSLSIFSS